MFFRKGKGFLVKYFTINTEVGGAEGSTTFERNTDGLTEYGEGVKKREERSGTILVLRISLRPNGTLP